MKLKGIGFKVPKELHQEIKLASVEEGISMSWFMEKAIREAIRRGENKKAARETRRT